MARALVTSLVAACLLLAGCAEPKTICGVTYDSYGLLNADDKKNPSAGGQAMTDTPKLQTYIIRFAIKSHLKITAASAEEAQAKFDDPKVSAEDLIADGYDDLEVDEPELLVED